MTSKKLNVLFLLKKGKENKKGLVPIFIRITFNNRRKEIASGLFIKPDNWDFKKKKAYPPIKNNQLINSQLELISNKLREIYLRLMVGEEIFDVEDIYLLYKGKTNKSSKSLLEVFELHNSRMERLIGKEYTGSTLTKFVECKSHVSNFLKSKYGRNDMLLSSIRSNFLDEFDFYLKDKKNHKQITINKSIQRLRKIIKLAIAEGYLDQDPFLMYKPKKYLIKISYLTKEELTLFEGYSFGQSRLQQVADMFVFCCYTGLAYAEMSVLSKKHLVNDNDGQLWIEMYRKKTQSSISVPVLPQALRVLNKYNYLEEKYNQVLPVISNQKFNSFLKEISAIVGIEKRLTHHMARKTFATTVLLSNKVPMDVVSKLLGHSKIVTTQEHYGLIVKQRLSAELKNIGKG